MKYELKRIGIWSAVKITFILSLIMGFIFGIFYALLIFMLTSLPMAMMQDDQMAALQNFGAAAAVILPFFMAFFMAIINTIFTVIGIAAYNLVARMTGGVEWELAEVAAQPAVTAPPAAWQPVPQQTMAPETPPKSENPPHSPFDKRSNEPPQDYSL